MKTRPDSSEETGIGGITMNLRKVATKLQTALCQKGRFIKLNQMQAYSEKTGRMVTKFVLTEKKKNAAGRMRDSTIMESYQLADIVKKLAQIYGGDSA